MQVAAPPRDRSSWALALAPFVFAVLIVLSIFPPFVPLAGPLSLDDLMPVAAILISIALLAFNPKQPLIDATVIGFALLALVSIVATAASAESMAAFFRQCGRSTGRVLCYQALLLGARSVLGDEKWPRRAIALFSGAATIEAIFCIWAYVAEYRGPYGLGVIGFADWSVLVGKIRVQGTFSGEQLTYESGSVSPNFLAAYLVMSIPATVGLIATLRGRWRWVAVAGALLQVATLYLTYTRAALVAFGLSILAMGFFAGRRKLAIGIFALGIAATLAIPSTRRKFLSEGHDRWSLYWASVQLTADRPVFGVGDGNYDRVLHQDQRYFDTPYGIATATSHNSVLLAAANLGIAGGGAHALLYVLLVAVLLREVRRLEGRSGRDRMLLAGVAAGIVGYLVQDQFNNLAYIPKVATQMWFLFALVPILARSIESRAVEEPRPVLRLYPAQ
jgi:hypothetical protein